MGVVIWTFFKNKNVRDTLTLASFGLRTYNDCSAELPQGPPRQIGNYRERRQPTHSVFSWLACETQAFECPRPCQSNPWALGTRKRDFASISSAFSTPWTASIGLILPTCCNAPKAAATPPKPLLFPYPSFEFPPRIAQFVFAFGRKRRRCRPHRLESSLRTLAQLRWCILALAIPKTNKKQHESKIPLIRFSYKELVRLYLCIILYT